jgi:glucose uptake protein
MFTPHSLGIALMMMITSAICWGSWANTYKGVKNYRFELFYYWDYAIGIFLISLILAFTMGSMGDPSTSLLANVRTAVMASSLLSFSQATPQGNASSSTAAANCTVPSGD